MHLVNWAASIAVLSGTIALAAPSPVLAQRADVSTCLDMQSQVKTALASSTQSANHDEAVKQQSFGQQFCASGLYRNGIEHYAAALKLLGANKT